MKKPLCSIPWTNIDINPSGYVSPCCKAWYKSRDEYSNLSKDTIDDYLNNPTLLEMKSKLSAGEWPDECARCKIDEENGLPSKRLLDYERWKDSIDKHQDGDGFLTVSVAFDNVCNLTCIMCTPMSSSKWLNEHNLIYSTGFSKVPEYKVGWEDELKELSPNVIHFDIHGGEPFLSKTAKQKEILEHYVKTGRSKDITLHYITNATIFPDDEWWSFWDHFKQVEIQLSIDAIGKRYDYIRFPGDWNTTLGNVNRYLNERDNRQNIQLSVSHTVSAYNVYYIDEFYSWCLEVGLPKPYLGRVHQPSHMRPEVWHQEAKETIIQKLETSEYEEVRAWASLVNSECNVKFSEFINYLHKHDDYRNLKFSEYFPEMAIFV